MPIYPILLLLLWLLEPRDIGCGWSSRGIAMTKCKEYYDTAMTWRLVFRRLPRSIEEMEAPMRHGGAFAEVVEDPWGSRYVLERDGDDMRVRSFGPDGQAATEDDIVYPEVRRRRER